MPLIRAEAPISGFKPRNTQRLEKLPWGPEVSPAAPLPGPTFALGGAQEPPAPLHLGYAQLCTNTATSPHADMAMRRAWVGGSWPAALQPISGLFKPENILE